MAATKRGKRMDPQVLERAARLKALATSSNEHEAANALAALQRLSDKHNLAVADLVDLGCESPSICSESKPVFCGGRDTPPWKLDLLLILADVNGCCEYHHLEAKGQKRYMLAGRPEDIERVRFLWARTVAVLSRLASQRFRRGSHGAWLLGAVRGIEIQLRRAQKETRAEATTTALAVVDRRRSEALKAIEQLCGRLPDEEPPCESRMSYRRYQDGLDIGRRLNLGLSKTLRN